MSERTLRLFDCENGRPVFVKASDAIRAISDIVTDPCYGQGVGWDRPSSSVTHGYTFVQLSGQNTSCVFGSGPDIAELAKVIEAFNKIRGIIKAEE